MKKIATIFLLMTIGIFVKAQEQPASTNPVSATSVLVEDKLGSHAWGASLNLTSNGIGVELSRSLTTNRKLVARIGGNYLAYDLKDFPYNNGSKAKPQYLLANANIVLGSIGAYIDWHPFGNAFKLTGGVAYLMSKVTSTAQLRDSTPQGDIQISPDEVGQIKAEIKPSSNIAPYIGIGFGRAIPKNRVGVSFEMGTYYMGSPNVDFYCTKMLEPTSSMKTVLSDNLSPNQWLPRLSLSINIKLTK
jgi:hypothetical protein